MNTSTTTISNHCDICQKNNIQPVRLHEWYSTNDINFLCDKCEAEVNAHLNKLKTLSSKWHERLLKMFMVSKKEKFTEKKK